MTVSFAVPLSPVLRGRVGALFPKGGLTRQTAFLARQWSSKSRRYSASATGQVLR